MDGWTDGMGWMVIIGLRAPPVLIKLNFRLKSKRSFSKIKMKNMEIKSNPGIQEAGQG